MITSENKTHNTVIGYIIWAVGGFLGAHRFYFGRPISGTVYFFTLGLCGIGWLLHTYLGIFGIHRFYLGKWGTGLLYLFTGGLAGIGYYYDYLGLNTRVSERNALHDKAWWT